MSSGKELSHVIVGDCNIVEPDCWLKMRLSWAEFIDEQSKNPEYDIPGIYCINPSANRG